jgi:hypothetical protein
MPTHLDYVAVRQRQEEFARQAERVRQEREGLAPAPASRARRFPGRLFARLRLRRPVEAPASTR